MTIHLSIDVMFMEHNLNSGLIPAKFGHYRVIQEVGAGGLGKVYKALDERTGKYVAIKLLHEKFLQNRKFLGIFHRELLILASLKHRHIVAYLDSFFEPPLCYIVTEFIDGWSGHVFLKRVGRVPPLVAVCIAIDILQGLDHLHLHEIIHSDLSAANYLIEKTGRIVVTDFGLSCKQEIEDYKNYIVGTPGYYSPEHISEASITPQTDIYCTGLILFELLTGQRAVNVSSDRHKILQNMKKIPVGLITCRDERLEGMLQKLVKGALHPGPHKRFPTAEHMMYLCYEILKRYKIRYSRHAIKKFLVDQGMIRGPFTGHLQDIYGGL